VWEGFRIEWLEEQILGTRDRQTAERQPATAGIVSEAWGEVCQYLPAEFKSRPPALGMPARQVVLGARPTGQGVIAVTEAEWLACADPTPMLVFLRSRASERALRLLACACCRRIWSLLTSPFSKAAVEVAERFADGLASESERRVAFAAAAREAAGWTNTCGLVHGAIGTVMSAAVYCVAKEDNLDAEMVAAGGQDVATMTDVIHLDEGVPLVPGIIATRDAAMAAGAAAIAWIESEERPTGEADEDTPEESQILVAGKACAALAGLGAGVGDVVAQREKVEAVEAEMQTRLVLDVFGNPFHLAVINPAWLTPTVNSLAAAAYEERILPSGELDTARLAVLADALEETGCTNADILSHLRSPGPHVRGCWAVDLILGK
jgi:hypothetical protein